MDTFNLTSPVTENNGEGKLQSEVKAIPNPFDPAQLRLSQDFASVVGVKKALLTVPARKPDPSWFVRVHPDESYRVKTGVLNLREDREIYLVAKPLWADLMTSEKTFAFQALHTAITRQGNLFLWHIGLPGADGKWNSWNLSAMEAAEKAMGNWVRVTSNSQVAGYDVVVAPGDIPPPTWPDVPFSEILRIAFKDFYIDDLNDKVLRRLRGEI